jgi:4-nitrophenyl phosphatase
MVADTEGMKRIKALLVDLDGVVYRGSTPLPGVAEFFDTLNSLQIRYMLITNNSTLTTPQFVEKVRRMGVPADVEQVLTSAEATGAYLAEENPPGTGVFVLGETGLREAMRLYGFDVDADAPRYVVVGMDRQLTYDKLYRACNMIVKGAGLIGSNPDTTLPTEDGIIPGCGALLAALTACTGVHPIIIGKPETRMLHLAMKRMGVSAEETAMLGDRLDTDVVAGCNAGIQTILVLTGISQREEIAAAQAKPDYVFEDLIEMAASLQMVYGAAPSPTVDSFPS